MKIGSGVLPASVLALLSAAVHGESHFSGTFSALADDESGLRTDIDMRFAPNRSWALDAGFSSTKAQLNLADVDGTSFRAGLGLHSQHVGLRSYYRSYSDSRSFATDTIGARVSVRSGRLGFGLIAEAHELEVEYTVGSAGDLNRGGAVFEGDGYGAGVSYMSPAWSVYAEALFYDFGSQLDHDRTRAALPTILGIPVVPRPASSVAALMHGVLDHQIGAGIERGFARSFIRLDWAGAEDAISGTTSNSFSAGFRYSLTENADIGITLGVTDSDFGSVNFAGASFGFSL